MDVIEFMDEDSMQLDSRSISIIESLFNTPVVTDNLYTVNIDGYLTEKYMNDFYGLLHNELGVSNNTYYLNMRVNGFKSSIEYDGRMNIVLVKQDTALKILESIRG